MAITYEPSKLIKKQRIREKAKKAVTSNFKVSKEALASLDEFGVLPAKTAEKVALKVAKHYKNKYDDLRLEGTSAEDARDEARGESDLLVARLQSAVIHEQTKVIRSAYHGEYYIWLKSTAVTPREEHLKNVGKKFQLGVGDADGNDPGDLYGCQCGMKILTDDTAAEFNQRLEDEL